MRLERGDQDVMGLKSGRIPKLVDSSKAYIY